MLTDRQLEQIAAELITDFAERVQKHREAKGDAFDFILSGTPLLCGHNSFLELIDTFQLSRTMDEAKALADYYSRGIKSLEEELITGFYDDHTRRVAKIIVQRKGLNVTLPPLNWFNPNEPEYNHDPPADFARICDRIINANIDCHRLEEERIFRKRDTPLQLQVAARLEAAKPQKKLSDLWQTHQADCIARNCWNPGTIRKNRDAYQMCLKILGDRELSSYTDDDATILLQILKDRGLSVSSIIFTIELLSTMFKRAMKRPKEWNAEYNPFEGKQPKDKRADHEQQLPYDKEDIPKIYIGLSEIRREVEPEKFWGPMSALHSAMRLNEVSQLRVEDIECLEDVWVFHIRHRPEAPYYQTVKGGRNRVCPVHPLLIREGFITYVQSCRSRKQDRLFDNVYLYDGKWKKKIGDWWNRTFEPKYLSKVEGKSFHSTRHSFIDWFFQNTKMTFTDLDILKSMVGHLDDHFLNALVQKGGITRNRYGKPYSPLAQIKMLKRLDYGVDPQLLRRKK